MTKRPDDSYPDIHAIDIPLRDRLNIIRLVNAVADLGRRLGQIKRERVSLSERLKQVLGQMGLKRFSVRGVRVKLYNAPRSVVDKGLLRAHGVDPKIIAASTITKDSWTLRVEGDENDDTET